jgi:hypothetical protein
MDKEVVACWHVGLLELCGRQQIAETRVATRVHELVTLTVEKGTSDTRSCTREGHGKWNICSSEPKSNICFDVT